MATNCMICGLQKWLCFCQEIPTLQLKTKLHFIVHYREAHKISNTARLFKMANQESGWFVYGLKDKPMQLNDILDESKKALVLFPKEGAQDLRCYLADLSPENIQLIIPDGNWGQAARMANRLSEDPRISFASLPATHVSSYRLRHNPNPGRICTFEAALNALKLIEPATDLAPIQVLFEKLVERLLWQRGKIPREQKEKRLMLEA